MIPVPKLDDELFQEINNNAVNKISGLCPQWTDYNKHDAGITFIELFSWLKEMQQYYLDNISRDMKEKYLMLLGMKKNLKKCAVFITECKNISDKNMIIPAHSKIFADNICFETCETEVICNNEIENIILCDGEIKEFSSESDRLIINQRMYILPFGKKCAVGECFEITFKNSLPCNIGFNLYFSVSDDYPVKRNPIYDAESFIPLAEMDISILSETGWKKADVISDETFCFLQSGNIRIKIPAEMKYDNGFRMKFTLRKCDYDVPPAITEIKINTIKIIQKKTSAICYDFENCGNHEFETPFTENSLSGKIDLYLRYNDSFVRCIDFHTDICGNGQNVKLILSKLVKCDFDGIRAVVYDSDFYENKSIAVTTGFPYQEIQLEKSTIMAENFRIMIYDRYDNVFYEWFRQDNFDMSDAESRHFVFDETSGIIKFGNGEKGLCPDGEIIITSYSETLAQDGNIKSMCLKSNKYDSISFDIMKNIESGQASESYDECIRRFTQFINTPEKNVTFEDFENCVYNTQGLMIKQCRAVTSQPFNHTNGIILIVQPYSDTEKPKLNDSYMKNILINAEKRKLIGTKVNVVSCSYIGIDIYAEICVKSHYVNTYEIISNAISSVFENNYFQLGGIVSYSSIYHLIDALDCVNYVKLLNITASGANYQISDSGDIVLSENGIAYLNSASYTISESR